MQNCPQIMPLLSKTFWLLPFFSALLVVPPQPSPLARLLFIKQAFLVLFALALFRLLLNLVQKGRKQTSVPKGSPAAAATRRQRISLWLSYLRLLLAATLFFSLAVLVRMNVSETLFLILIVFLPVEALQHVLIKPQTGLQRSALLRILRYTLLSCISFLLAAPELESLALIFGILFGLALAAPITAYDLAFKLSAAGSLQNLFTAADPSKPLAQLQAAACAAPKERRLLSVLIFLGPCLVGMLCSLTLLDRWYLISFLVLPFAARLVSSLELKNRTAFIPADLPRSTAGLTLFFAALLLGAALAAA